MIRLIHAQTTAGPIRVDDIDDGLPNKEVHRLGSSGNPKAYARDGYANSPKQPMYVPYSHTTPTGSVVPGFITLEQTERVVTSSGKGKISKLAAAGLIQAPVSLVAANIVTPVITAATTSSTNFVITGTTLTSVSPDTTVVTFAIGSGATVASPAVWTQAAIVAASGSIVGTTITIPMSAFTLEPVTGNTVTVNANEKVSNTFSATSVTDLTPVISAATATGHGSNFVITGTYLSPLTTLITFAMGTGGTTPSPVSYASGVFTSDGIIVTPTTITIPLAAFASQVPVAGNTVVVTTDGHASNTFSST